jgi:hypothetical protein
MTTKQSPLTGHIVETLWDINHDVTYFEDKCGRWAITDEAEFREASILGGRLSTRSGRLSEVETAQVLALARSEVWRLANLQGKTPLFMTVDGARAARQREIDDRSVILTIEEMIELAPTLGLEEKALKTLENLAGAEGQIGAGVDIPYSLKEYPGRPVWPAGEPPREDGCAYGCTATEAPMAYQFLLRTGLIVVRPHQAMGESSRAFLTPEGYVKLRELKSGDTAVSQGFMVCRFIPEVDELFDRVVRPLGGELGCTVRRIKDIHHIDKIDDRICAEIRRSRIVLVDLTENNFNVGFEAGYALALNKPIVWTKREEARDAPPMPFDIYAYNCLQWHPEKTDEFRDALRFRIVAALQRADRRS